MKTWSASRAMRRLLVAGLALAAVDPLVVRVVRFAEHARYESDRLFRFENSDLFALGPVVEYLNEHPAGSRPRVAFFGNSFVWGYGVPSGQTIPAEFQRLVPGVRVFNLGINGFETGNAYLITKQIIDAVDLVYVFHIGREAHPLLSRLIPVEEDDLVRFGLSRPDRLRAWLEDRLSVWRLYRYSHRLQAALFGTSTRLYLYMHKADLLPSLLGAAVPRPPVPDAADSVPDVGALRFDRPVSASQPSSERLQALAERHPLLWDFATFVRARGKRAVFIQTAGGAGRLAGERLTADEHADLNAHFRPHVTFAWMEAEPSLLLDSLHLNPRGTATVAAALRDATSPTAGRPGT
jgi:hypothetical protein